MYTPKVKSSRQQAKEKSKAIKGKTVQCVQTFPGYSYTCHNYRKHEYHKFMMNTLFYADLYFLVQWEDGDEEDGHDLLDVLPAKAIITETDMGVASLGEGVKCQAMFEKNLPCDYCKKW